MSTNSEQIEFAFKSFEKRNVDLRNDIKEYIKILLLEEDTPIIDFPEFPAYCTDDNGGVYYEVPAYGVRYHNGALEVSIALCNDYTDWTDADAIRSEYNHHCTINWISILDSIRFAYRKYE